MRPSIDLTFYLLMSHDFATKNENFHWSYFLPTYDFVTGFTLLQNFDFIFLTRY